MCHNNTPRAGRLTRELSFIRAATSKDQPPFTSNLHSLFRRIRPSCSPTISIQKVRAPPTVPASSNVCLLALRLAAAISNALKLVVEVSETEIGVAWRDEFHVNAEPFRSSSVRSGDNLSSGGPLSSISHLASAPISSIGGCSIDARLR